jgi:hypothetical protein
MKRFLAASVLLSLALARVEVTTQPIFPIVTVSAPVITISTQFRISLVPNIVVIEREPEPDGVVVVYRSSRVRDVYSYHDRDLSRRGWVRTRYQAGRDGYRAEYRRGKAKARLEVRDRRGRVEVKVRER